MLSDHYAPSTSQATSTDAADPARVMARKHQAARHRVRADLHHHRLRRRVEEGDRMGITRDSKLTMFTSTE